MDTLVNSIVALSASQESLSQLVGYLKGADEALDNPAHNCLEAAQALDAQQHSLGIVFLLLAHARRANFNADGAWAEYACQFLSNCAAAQIQLVPEQFVELCHAFREQLTAPSRARLGVRPLLAALERLAPHKECLTPIHADVLQLCLLAKTYNAAAPLLDVELTDVDPQRTATGPTDLLLYCYYGGMVATGRKQLGRALELFLQALTAPTFVASAITAAAYKKYALVSLIHNGSVAALPKFASQKVRQLVADSAEVKPYTSLAAAYSSKTPDKLRRVAEQHMTAFSADGNVGLLKQVLASLPVRTIQRLTQTYLTLSLSDIAAAAGLGSAAEAEDVILRMVSCRQVFARINDRDGMVTFMQDPQQYNSASTARRIEDTIKQVMSLAQQVQGVQDGLLLDRSYLNKLVLRERGGGGLGGLGGGDADFGPGMFGA